MLLFTLLLFGLDDAIVWPLLIMTLVSAGVSVGGIFNQRSMLSDQQDFNSAEAEKARDWSSEPERFDRMTSLGFNPDLAAASIMGNVQSTPYAASSPVAPQTPSMLDGFQNLLSQLPELSMKDVKNDAVVTGINLDNDIKRFELGWKPILYTEQVNWYKASIGNILKDTDIKEFNRQQLEARAPYAKMLAAEEYFQALYLTDKMFTDVQDVWASVAQKYADVDLKRVVKDWYIHDTRRVDSQTSLNYNLGFQAATQGRLNEQSTLLTIDQQGLVKAQTATEEARALAEFQGAVRQFIDNQTKLGGVYIPGDMLYDSVMAEYADEDGKFLCKTFLQAERDIYDSYVQSRWKNYKKEFVMNLGDAVPEFIRGFIPVARQGVYNRNPKKPSVNTNVKGNPSSNTTFGGSRPVKLNIQTGKGKNVTTGYPMGNGGYYWE